MTSVNSRTGVSNNALSNPSGVEETSQDEGAKKAGSQENKKGAAAKLKAMLTKFKVWISGAESKKAVTESLSTSKQLEGRNTGDATKNIRKEVPNKLLIRYPQEHTALTGSQKQSQSVATPVDSPPPYSLHDPLTAINDSAEEMEALLDALDGLPNQAPDKQDATGLKGLSAEDDQKIDAMLGKLNMEDSPELDDLEKLSQEIEKEFGSSIQEQNQQSNTDRSTKIGRPATRPGLHQSTESKKEIKQFFKEHNKMTKALDSAGQSENTVGTKSSNIANPVKEASPTKGTIPTDSDFQELDDLSNKLAAMVNKQGTEKI